MRWLHSIIDSMDMNLSQLQEIVEDREACMLLTMGLQRVRHNLATEKQQQINILKLKPDSLIHLVYTPKFIL